MWTLGRKCRYENSQNSDERAHQRNATVHGELFDWICGLWGKSSRTYREMNDSIQELQGASIPNTPAFKARLKRFLLMATPEELESVAAANPKAITSFFRFADSIPCRTTPLHLLCQNPRTTARHVKAFLKHISASDVLLKADGLTALQYACMSDLELEVLEELVKQNPSILFTGIRHHLQHPISLLCASNGLPNLVLPEAEQRTLGGDIVDLCDEFFQDVLWEKACFLVIQAFRQMKQHCPFDLG